MEGERTRKRPRIQVKAAAIAALLLCGAWFAAQRWTAHATTHMSFEEALRVLTTPTEATPEAFRSAAAALGRQANVAIVTLKDLARYDDPAGEEARARIQHLREAIR